MKSKLLFIALLTLGFSTVQAQSQTTVYAKNSDISDNLDLRAVASIFGESANLQDFERRLNDPKYQISNLDLNDDDEVDYLRVIESVEDRTHVVIIQAVLDRDVYQDIATIDIERDNSNKVVVQVVGNSYLYGDNYIYEPVYNVAPVIYTSFWITNYRPYYSTWGWNYYPTYYTAWRPYPIYRYRRNINVCINVNNHYNYVNTRRSYRAPVLYATRRSYGYETRRPNYSFSQRHANTNNRYELDQRRVATREAGRNQNVNNTNRYNPGRTTGTDNRNNDNRNNDNRNNDNRNATVNRPSDRNYNTNRVTTTNRDNAANVNTPARVENTQRNDVRRNSNETNTRVYSENRGNSNRTAPVQRTETPRSMPENRGGSENRANTSRAQAPQRTESPRANQESRGSQPQRENGSGSRGGNRRG
ncbi:DUF4887 domain-containing protein [Flavobacterium sp. ENC]|uniref:DUF4887 domain-containing protein n=1 Tax=Flavobacterium sp. ENC TaxID=2897330 RepID=UPI001E2CA097|nr:DUF4887 domain-containing protein [Flavobacterium sp. ENC]MCD0465645.1 DUF4887 domain-containing protein [Flavobacterium sp. ENC]